MAVPRARNVPPQRPALILRSPRSGQDCALSPCGLLFSSKPKPPRSPARRHCLSVPEKEYHFQSGTGCCEALCPGRLSRCQGNGTRSINIYGQRPITFLSIFSASLKTLLKMKTTFNSPTSPSREMRSGAGRRERLFCLAGAFWTPPCPKGVSRQLTKVSKTPQKQ